jgi:hypothetical protein
MHCRVRQTWYLAFCAAIVISNPAMGEVMLEVGPAVDLGVGGLRQYTVSAVGTDDEFINVFGMFNLTGSVHQVGSPASAGNSTVSVDDLLGAGFDPSWSSFDTHWLYPQHDLVMLLGTPPSEQNDLTTIGTLGLSPWMDFDAPSGFGDFSTPDGAYVLLPEVAGSSVPFLQVVTNSTATLGMEIAFLNSSKSSASSVIFADVSIGASAAATTFAGWPKTPPAPPVTIEEPATTPTVARPPAPPEVVEYEPPAVIDPPVAEPPIEAPPLLENYPPDRLTEVGDYSELSHWIDVDPRFAEPVERLFVWDGATWAFSEVGGDFTYPLITYLPRDGVGVTLLNSEHAVEPYLIDAVAYDGDLSVVIPSGVRTTNVTGQTWTDFMLDYSAATFNSFLVSSAIGTAVPEPTTLALLLLASIGRVGIRRRR